MASSPKIAFKKTFITSVEKRHFEKEKKISKERKKVINPYTLITMILLKTDIGRFITYNH